MRESGGVARPYPFFCFSVVLIRRAGRGRDFFDVTFFLFDGLLPSESASSSGSLSFSLSLSVFSSPPSTMGRKSSAKDRAYITQSERKDGYGSVGTNQ